MSIAIAVALGGAAGALLRWAVAAPLNTDSFPWGTLLVNVLGSLIIGALLVFFADRVGSEALRAGLVVGLLGGFTTFSAFSLETVQLIERGQITSALSYAIGSLIICVLAAYAGIRLTKILLAV